MIYSTWVYRKVQEFFLRRYMATAHGLSPLLASESI